MRLNRVDLLLVAAVVGPLGMVPIFGRTPRLWCVDVVIAVLTIALILQAGMGRLRFTGAEPWVGIYLLISLLTVMMSPDILRFIVLFKLRVMPLLVLLIVYNTLQTQEDLRHTQIGLALCAMGIAIMMLINTYVYTWGYAQLDIGLALKETARSNIGKNNYLASIYAFLTPFCLSLFSIRKRLLGLVTSLIVVTAILVTQSRGGVLCLIVGLVTWAFLIASPTQKIKSLLYMIIVIGALAGALYAVKMFFPETVLKTFAVHSERLWRQIQEDPGSISRVQLLKDGFAAFRSSPLIGVGLGGYVEYSIGGRGTQVHNLYLELLMMTGIFGFMAYMTFLFVCGRNLFRLRNAFPAGPGRILVASMSAAFVSTLLNAAVEPSYWSPVFSCLFAIVLAMAFAQRRIVLHGTTATRSVANMARPALHRPSY